MQFNLRTEETGTLQKICNAKNLCSKEHGGFLKVPRCQMEINEMLLHVVSLSIKQSCKIWENCEHQKYFWNVIVLQEKSESGVRKLNRKQER